MALLFSPPVSAKDVWKDMVTTALTEEEFFASPAYINKVFPGSPAAKAGVLEGDTIISINGEPVLAMKDAVAILDKKPKSLNVGLKRDEAIMDKNLILDSATSKIGVLFGEGTMGIMDNSKKKKVGCNFQFGNILVSSSIQESPGYYRVWLWMKNFGKEPVDAPAKIMLQDSNSTMLRFMAPQELIYATYGTVTGIYIPPPPSQQIVSLPTSYTSSSSTTVIGNTAYTQGSVRANNSSSSYAAGQQFGYNLGYNLGVALGQRRANNALAQKQQDEVFLNSNYLRKTSIPADAAYQGVAFFAKNGPIQEVKLTTYVNEKEGGVCSFVSSGKKRK